MGNEVRDVFVAKCAVCHDSDSGKPKGRFGYVLDLRRVAGNPEKVIAFRPIDSELWDLVEHDEMPPKDSPHGALSQEQKEVIREWIATGAPDASPLTWSDRLVRWLGKFHLLLLHFPIALVLAAGIGEIWSLWRRNTIPSELVRFCLCLGALAAILTAILGWLHAAAGNGASSPQLLLVHRWLGTTTAVWLIIVAVCAELDARRGVRSRGVWLLLLSGCLITAITAFFGGRLAHGGDFFNF
jgi:uncharacterized membrane protein